MTKMSDTTITILQIIADSTSPIKSDAIRLHESLRGEDGTRISNALYNLKKGGFAVADNARCYSIAAAGRALLSENGRGVAIKKKPRGARGAPPPHPHHQETRPDYLWCRRVENAQHR